MQVAKDGNVNSPAIGSAQPGSNAQPTVHRAQPSSNDDVTTSAPPPPTDNQSNPRPKRQRKRSAVTTETLNATRNAVRYMTSMRFLEDSKLKQDLFFFVVLYVECTLHMFM